MNLLQQQILNPFVAETLTALDTLAQLTATAGDAFEDDVASFRFKGYAVATEVSGAVPGKVLLHLYPETATDVGRRVYASMIGDCIPDACADDFQEALTEWANVLIGKATRSLEVAHLNVEFKPPFFVNNTDDMTTLMSEVVEIVSVPIHAQQAGRFYFNYLLHAKSGNV